MHMVCRYSTGYLCFKVEIQRKCISMKEDHIGLSSYAYACAVFQLICASLSLGVHKAGFNIC